jgi:hypothetical protein
MGDSIEVGQCCGSNIKKIDSGRWFNCCPNSLYGKRERRDTWLRREWPVRSAPPAISRSRAPVTSGLWGAENAGSQANLREVILEITGHVDICIQPSLPSLSSLTDLIYPFITCARTIQKLKEE